MVRVLAIDPGERVGYATGVIKPMLRPVMTSPSKSFTEACKTDVGALLRGEPTTTYVDEEFQVLEITGHGISGLKDFAMKLGDVFSDYDVVIYERFRLAAGLAMKLAGSDMQTSQLIGIIRYLGWKHPNVKLVQQKPADMKTGEAVANDHIKAIIAGAPKNHDDAHHTSALRHLSYYHWKTYV